MKIKLAIAVAFIGLMTLLSASLIRADNTPPSVSCSGNVSNNVVHWTTAVTGGISPYTYLWSGDSHVANSTGSSVTASYAANGTYTANILVTDSSSTVATATCSAVISYFTKPSVSCSGNVSNNVINWTTTVTGGISPYTYLWSGDSHVANSTGSSVTATYSSNGTYTANILVTDSSSTVATATCSAVISYFPHPGPVPTKLPWVNQPILSIGPKGAFLARGMTVTSVASSSFQAQVWGITYTVNWPGYLYPKFYFRFGNTTTSTLNPVEQLSVGDEVGVSGKVSTSSPFVVNAAVVRDYSLGSARPIWNIPHKGESNGGNDDKGKSNDEKGESNENKNTTTFPSIQSIQQEMRQRLNDLKEQIKNFRENFKNNFRKK